jgi:peptidoglycan/LPS O-acetylase OafA/YrhL
MEKGVAVHNRLDVQYLRALAVVSVVAYHFWPNRLVSGFLGVDVFFVISGFLITSLILREVSATGTLRLSAFWVRRIRRIFPAAITVIIATAIATNLSGLTAQILASGRHVFASAFSFENILLGLDATDYDRRGDMTSPLQHYWSLSVEEQFYLVWPILVIGAIGLAKISRVSSVRLLGIAIVGIAAGSLIYAIVVTQGVAASYFDTLARAWELALGAGVALLAQRDIKPWRGQLITNRLAWLALATTFAIPGLNDFTPGIGVLPAVLATAIILATGNVSTPKTSGRRVVVSEFSFENVILGLDATDYNRRGDMKLRRFAQPVLFVAKWVGDRSYSIYLWHWPIVILSPVFLGFALAGASKIGALVLVLILAELTYRFVENPVRHARASWTFKPLFAGSIALVTSAAVVAVTVLYPHDLGEKEPPDPLLASMLSEPLEVDAPRLVEEFQYTLPYCVGAGAAVFVCPNGNLVEFDASSYRPVPPPSATCPYEVANSINDCVIGDTAATRSIALVGDSHAQAMWASIDLIGKRANYAVHLFIASRCSYRLDHFRWCTRRNLEIQPRLNSGEFDLVILAQSAEVIEASVENPVIPANPFVELFGELHANGINVAVVKDNPKRGPELYSCLLYNRNEPGSCTVPFQPQMDLATQTALDLKLPVINLDTVYCPGNRCGAVRGGMFVWRDDGHIWPFFHLTAAPLVWSQLMEHDLIHPQR